ncbi:MAG: S9 family peptidase [Flavobacteriales bacterium CG_4_10_14_0_2_um_filter_32_8]|nr:MAG: S9 family peptidase [Flavobacteriales bacterium CG_4_10_14_0_2_um_filter_32_8]PJB14803.1 MAG: S9 family peptidase [Flavobacteriales bacterium CG_4_9_14_3_um_filter_32_8]
MRNLILIALLLGVFGSIFGQEKKIITLEDIWKNHQFSQETISGLRSMKDGSNYTVLETIGDGRSIVKYSYLDKNKQKVIVNASDLVYQDNLIKIDDYQFSSDETKLLIATEDESIYRHSSKSHYFIYDLVTKSLTKLTTGSKQLYATFSPLANKVAFVKDNNLFYKDLTTDKEVQITTDGASNKIMNGVSDWVYEEELVLVKAFEWSPDGNKIAFYRFDESGVKEWLMQLYGPLYPSEERFKYPKAGEDNSKVAIYFYDVPSTQTTKANIGNNYEYISRINWTNDSKNLAIQSLNRHQNDLIIHLTDALTGESKIIYQEQNDKYVEVPTSDFLTTKNQFTITSEKDGYNHIYLYDISGKLINQITKGNWDVTGYYGVDEKNGIIYYQSAEVTPMERQVYSIKLNGSSKKQLTILKGTNDADFSTSFKYFINYHTSANTPNFITLNDNKGKVKSILEDNFELKDKLTKVELTKKEFFKINVNGNELNAWKILPSNFDETKKYPVLMYVYGGPGINTVNDAWEGNNYFWFQLLASKGYIVVSVDNRGTGARGEAFKKITYLQLGKYETEDQIASAKYLATLPYIDGSRIGIFGWSYGGYMSSLCITKGADVFKTAIAVAPVTNWRFYDNIYTERYMQTPQENAAGYDDNSPINHVEKLKGNYLLIHGMADDNVHYQNTTEMISALINANKQFTQMSYPNKNHGIYGGNTRLHLYNLMTNFILENL